MYLTNHDFQTRIVDPRWLKTEKWRREQAASPLSSVECTTSWKAWVGMITLGSREVNLVCLWTLCCKLQTERDWVSGTGGHDFIGHRQMPPVFHLEGHTWPAEKDLVKLNRQVWLHWGQENTIYSPFKFCDTNSWIKEVEQVGVITLWMQTWKSICGEGWYGKSAIHLPVRVVI